MADQQVLFLWYRSSFFSLIYISLLVIAIIKNAFPKILRRLVNASYTLLIAFSVLVTAAVSFFNSIQDRKFIAGSIYCIHTNSDMLMKMTEVRLVRYTFQGSETIASETHDGYPRMRIETNGARVYMVPN
ncbi:MAG: hypothetical protein EOP56_17750 [Sphingobacteriales bacterium]|nr:MAG: hypothetical protein EOP56_17750 [Sphingobacteriales bacterium]